MKLKFESHLGRVKRIWYLSPMRAAKVQASLRIRAVSPEPSLLAHTSSESRGTFRQKTRSLAPLNGWACAIKMCHDGMLEDTNSLDGARLMSMLVFELTAQSFRWKGSVSGKLCTALRRSTPTHIFHKFYCRNDSTAQKFTQISRLQQKIYQYD